MDEISCLGVSKFLEMETGDREVRYIAAKAIDEVDGSMEVHLLGCSDGSRVVRKTFEDFPMVRGCDSAFVYLASQAGERIGEKDVDRPAGEIDFLNGADYDSLASNMDAFNILVGVGNDGVDGSWE